MFSKKEYRGILARYYFCRSFLYLSGLITESENNKIQERIRKFQDKHKIEITQDRLLSINFHETTNETD